MINISPIGYAYNERVEVMDDYWGSIITTIKLTPPLNADSLQEIENFSHLEIIYYMHLVQKDKIILGARHPRNNISYPLVGIFAQRAKNRPNQLGSTIVKLVKIEGSQLFVQGLDCINKTPIIDIKPVMNECLPKGKVTQPKWSQDIMKKYWN